MQIFRDWTGLPAAARGASAAIGNFDGVHLGHRAVIDLARPHGPLAILTFEPHPREVFSPDAPAFRLMNAGARAHRLEKLGVERLFEMPFDARLSGMSPEEFARDVIADGLGLSHVVVGADFCFGKGRAGKAADLVALGRTLGFGVTVADLVSADGAEVSSTAIRTALSDGRPRDAASMLGHWHRIEGEVLHGDKRGRTLGYPTANMGLSGLHVPRHGIYAVLVDVLDGPHAGARLGVASLGIRPMFELAQPSLEVHLFDFAGDLYGATLSVALVDWLRGEKRFDSLEALVAQMDADSATARVVLAGL
jgi:riboflavin kinase / FMN adenylyltransferase